MSIFTVRSLFEREMLNAFTAEGVPVVFDNIQEEPPTDARGYYVMVTISFPALTTPVLCREEPMLMSITGNIQVSIFGPRSVGMKRMERLAEIAVGTLCGMPMAPDPSGVHPNVGAISGPNPVLTGTDAKALTVLSAPFTARGA